jgi:hypothetical protein
MVRAFRVGHGRTGRVVCFRDAIDDKAGLWRVFRFLGQGLLCVCRVGAHL